MPVYMGPIFVPYDGVPYKTEGVVGGQQGGFTGCGLRVGGLRARAWGDKIDRRRGEGPP